MEFRVDIFIRKLKHYETFLIEPTKTGWNVKNFPNGRSDPNGQGGMIMQLDRNFVNFPPQTGDYLEWLWHQIQSGEINEHEEIQQKLNDLAGWVSICEKATPKWKGTDF
jgi:hypothetical protein